MSKNKSNEALLYSTIGVGAMFLILIFLNLIASRAKVRVDLTQDKIFTLSEGTKSILKKLDTPVKIRFYYTQGENAMPVPWQNHARRVEDLLDEYQQHSKGLIELEKLDPQPDSDAEESANLDGVEGMMVNMTDKIYLGLAVSCLDAKFPVTLSPDREKLLEYDISRAISQVISPTKPVVGVMSSLPVFGSAMNPMMMQMGRGGQQPAWVFINELKRDFNVKQIETSVDHIEDDIKVLLVLHPKNLPEPAQFAIDQFVLKGGSLIAFVDPLCVVDSTANPSNPLQRAASSGSSLDKLFKAWGIEFSSEKVVADMNFVTQLSRGGRPEALPTVLSINKDGVLEGDVVTSQIDNLLMAFSGVFSGTPVSGLTQTTLLKTTPDSAQIEKFMAEFAGGNINKDYVRSGKEQSLAIRLSGKFKTAFPEGKPAAAPPADGEKKEEKKGEGLKEGTKEAVVVLFGDVDMLYDQFTVRVQNFFGQQLATPLNQNLNLAQNLVEQMSGDSSLIQVRTRATISRPFTVVKKMQAQAEESYRAKIKQLEGDLANAQQRLNELQRTKQDKNQRFIMSPEQQQELANFRKKEAEVKKELKDVRKQLRRDIDSLENSLKWVNIAGMPLGVTVAGILLAMMKRKKTAAK
ncbi:MAG: hypothetical protein FJ404_10935 [Verrucomicrobia bacterium]|nr:hypothetical protein [Verrucomicrobiota bacterium]